MARAIEQIERDLTQLKSQSLKLGEELEQLYQKYFALLGPAIAQQTIQASYYLCTTSYPDQFLRLSASQREHLLKSFQRVIKYAIADLEEKLSPPQPEGISAETKTTKVASDRFTTPESLYNWHKELEQAIQHTTTTISHKVNLLLQQAQILPSSLPKSILEATTKAGERGENMANLPNLLSVLIERSETEDSDEEEDLRLNIIQIDTLYLRLTEIEFVDMEVMSWRKQINQLVSKIRTLRREYQHKQKDLKIAEAESAWRNSWFEDKS